MKPVPDVSRRRLSRRRMLSGVVAGGVSLGVVAGSAACTGGVANGGMATSSGTPTPDNPLGVDRSAPVELVVFDGGYGHAYAEAQLALYNQWAGGDVARMSSTASVAATISPRIEDHDPPDVFDNSGSGRIPMASLVARNALADLGPLLEAPSVDDPDTSVADTLLPGVVDLGSYDGVVRELNYAFELWGLWHSSSLFAEHGWTPATTWDAFCDLLDKIGSSGDIAPFIHAGTHGNYLGTLLTGMAVKHAGRDLLVKIDNLDPQAWTDDSMIMAATAIAQLHSRGLIAPGADTLDHTTSQAKWLRGDAAVIVCGSWLEHEMRGEIPQGFDMVAAPFPSLADDDAMPQHAMVGGAGEPFVVCQQGRNGRGGMELLRQLVSKAGASAFADATGSLAAVKDAGKHLSDPSRALRSVADLAAAAGNDLFQLRYDSWYTELKDAITTQTTALSTGSITAEQFCENMQRTSDAVAGNPKIKKFRRAG